MRGRVLPLAVSVAAIVGCALFVAASAADPLQTRPGILGLADVETVALKAKADRNVREEVADAEPLPPELEITHQLNIPQFDKAVVQAGASRCEQYFKFFFTGVCGGRVVVTPAGGAANADGPRARYRLVIVQNASASITDVKPVKTALVRVPEHSVFDKPDAFQIGWSATAVLEGTSEYRLSELKNGVYVGIDAWTLPLRVGANGEALKRFLVGEKPVDAPTADDAKAVAMKNLMGREPYDPSVLEDRLMPVKLIKVYAPEGATPAPDSGGGRDDAVRGRGERWTTRNRTDAPTGLVADISVENHLPWALQNVTVEVNWTESVERPKTGTPHPSYQNYVDAKRSCKARIALLQAGKKVTVACPVVAKTSAAPVYSEKPAPPRDLAVNRGFANVREGRSDKGR